MVSEVGFDLEIMQILQKNNVSYILKTTNANSITQVVWDSDISPELVKELQDKYYEVTIKPVALVCALGTNIAKPGILAKATNALADSNINIDCISQSLKQVNMQFVINRGDYKKAIIVLNDVLCVNP